MNIRLKKKENLNKRAIYLKYALFCVFFFLYFLEAHAQDSILVAKDLTEEKELKFQDFFFKALSEKSIGNYQKAIENLESCNQVLTNDVAVYFEFSKNYLLLNKTFIAKEYAKRALIKEPNNIWILKHLVKIHAKDRDLSDAIAIQQKVVAINRVDRTFLLELYLDNREYKKAISLMNDLEKENALPSSFQKIKDTLEKRKGKTVAKEKTDDVVALTAQFKANKSYTILKQILEESSNNVQLLLNYSDEGIALFPAQPFVYLVKGRALNNQKKYKKALLILQNGIDFVIEDTMEADFYIEMAASYKGLGDFLEEKKFIQKSNKIKS
ncbi:hypothetical protein [uncultured Polaribacter sp.]|uniref:tetratricopeptide repeat protein n=1 Tax=uncultured Polaribacter sp. TaxID=174711 RepID=UPI002611D79E|nr:hypothetical protein [uncultured Polaribacter sp.]